MAYVYKGKIRDVEEEPTRPAACGTNSGYMRHGLDKTPKCQPCKDAHAAANRKHRKAPKMRNQCATYPGYMRHVRAGEQPCDLCRAAHARYMAEYRARSKQASQAA